MRAFILALFGVSLLLGQADHDKQPILLTDLLKIRQIVEIAMARDGSTAVYAVKSVHAEPAADGKSEPAYKYRNHLFRLNLNDPAAVPVQLTFGDKTDSGIALSPDGRQLAFIRLDTSRERPRTQVWLMPMTVGGEAHSITALDHGIREIKWRPDGKALLVTSAIPLSKIPGKPQFSMDRPGRDWFDYERPAPGAKPAEIPAARPDGDRAAIRQWLERNATQDNPSVITRLNFQDEQRLQREMVIQQLWMVDLENGNKAQQITRGFYPHFNCDWSSDSARLACVSWPASNEHPDRVRRTNLVVMNAKGGDRRVVCDRPGYTFASPKWYPGNASLLITVRDLDGMRQGKLARLDLAKEDYQILANTYEDIGPAQVASDGAVLFTQAHHGGVPLNQLGRTGTVSQLVAAPAGVQMFEEAEGRILFSKITVTNPNELMLREKDGSVRQVTALNSAWLANKELSLPEEHWLTRPDGTKVQYWVMKPARAEAGRKYPWILDMHGGPAAMWGPGEFSMWHEFQTFCSWGYGVVYANPRGSSGYGSRFQNANFKNWGEGPSADVLAALDDTIRTYPMVDKDRLFLTGGSYAGYLTAWIIGHDHRFKAAASQRGVYDLTTFYGEGNAFRLVESHFGGLPWDTETKKILDRESPFSYVSKIKTPLLILHGSQDLRTGVSQSEMLYRALRQQEKPVEYVRYPNIGHELTRSGPPLQRMDHLLRIVEFFERFSNNDREPPMEKPRVGSGAPSGIQ